MALELIAFKKKFVEFMNRGEAREFQHLLESTQIKHHPPNDSEITNLKKWYENIHSLAFLEEIIKNESINEIILHSHQCIQLDSVQKSETLKITDLSGEDYQLALEVLANKCQMEWNWANPFASFHTSLFSHQFRATLIHFSTSPPNYPSKLMLRRIKSIFFPLSCFEVNETVEEFLLKALREKKNILISGATGSGKTSLLTTLTNLTPNDEHIIILEDTHEIHSSSPLVTPLLSGSLAPKKQLKDYCAYALRMRPDRIILGEMRSHEVAPFILSLNTGLEGLLSTVHANSAAEAISRVALLFSLYCEIPNLTYNQILKLICTSIDYIIHLKHKKVDEIIEVFGAEQGVPIWNNLS